LGLPTHCTTPFCLQNGQTVGAPFFSSDIEPNLLHVEQKKLLNGKRTFLPSFCPARRILMIIAATIISTAATIPKKGILISLFRGSSDISTLYQFIFNTIYFQKQGHRYNLNLIKQLHVIVKLKYGNTLIRAN